MLRYLRVTNLAVVREAELELDPGLTVLTGETGAGKSILVDAVVLLLGARPGADQVRTGEATAAVEGIFRVDRQPSVLAALAGIGIEADDGELVLRREVSASGRSRAFVGGVLQPVATLRRLGSMLAEVHGQLDHHRLLDPTTHLDLLDHAADLGALRREVAQAWERRSSLEARLEELDRGAADRARRLDFLAFEVAEIDDAVVRPGEQEDLERERGRLKHRARLVELSESGFQRLYEADGSVLASLAALGRDLGELAGFDSSLAPLTPRVESARATLEDVALQLRDLSRSAGSGDAARLGQVESRLALLDRLQRKYGPRLEDVLAFAERSRAEIAALGASGDERSALAADLERARTAYAGLASQASGRRREAAARLEARVERELAELAMEECRFEVRIDPLPEGGPRGIERAEFFVAPNPGEDARRLARIASGGELARLLLALRVAAGEEEPDRVTVVHGLEAGPGAKVSVFDEVDAGIGGRVAQVLARKLRRLAAGRQVLCVTHLAPVAAAADHHFRIDKTERGGRTEVDVASLGRDGRLKELGRMIAGDAQTDAVRRHAAELLVLMGERGPG